MEKADLEIMLIREQGHGEVAQAFNQNTGPELIRMFGGKEK